MTFLRHSLLVMAFLASATLAYVVSHRAQEADARIAELQQEIADEERVIAALQAEWAFLSRGDRLADLVQAHNGELGLEPTALGQLARFAGDGWESNHD